MKETLGDRYTLSMEYTYKQTIKFMLDTLTDAFKRPGSSFEFEYM